MHALVRIAAIELSSELLSGIFVETFCCPRGTAWANLRVLLCALDPGPTMPKAPPVCRRERSFPLTQIGRFSFVRIKLKEPHSFAATTGPICNGAHLAGDDREQKTALRRRTLRLKSISPAQPSHCPTFNVQPNTNVQPFGAPNERNRATVKRCNLEGEARRRVRGLGVCCERVNVCW